MGVGITDNEVEASNAEDLAQPLPRRVYQFGGAGVVQR